MPIQASAPLGQGLAGYRELGSSIAGGNALPSALAEAQGESLGANTQNAIEEAQLRQQKLKARQDPALAAKIAAVAGSSPEVGALISALIPADVNPNQTFEAIGTNQKTGLGATIANAAAPQANRVAAAQALSPGGLANPMTDANQQLALARAADAQSHVPVNESVVPLNKAKAGYYDRSPGAGMGSTVGEYSPALKEAISKGLIDETRINSRNWRGYDQMAQHDPTLDVNAAHGGAAAQSNVPFAQKRAVLAALPGNIEQMVALGNKVNYPDLQIGGEIKKWALGQNNDPDLTAYMGVRNDTLLNLASVMRGIGMSDQAHTAELEAANPTMSPRALEAWAREQQALVARRSGQYNNVLHPNIHPNAPAPAPGAAPAPAAPGAAPAAPGIPAGWVVTEH